MANKILELFGIDTDPILGLDIGSTAVKIMELSRKNGRIRVERYAMEPLEPGVVVEKIIMKREKVVAALKAVAIKAQIISKKVCVSIPNSTAITKIIELGSDLSDRDIGLEIEMDAERHIPYPLEDVNLDYTVIGPVAGKEDLVNVLLVASKKENIENIEEIVTEAGLDIAVVGIDSFAVQRSYEFLAKKLPEGAQDKIVAVFDVGATTMTLNVFDRKNIVYTREQAFGGQHLIDQIQNTYGLTYDEAILALTYEDLPSDYYTEILEPFKQSVAQQVIRLSQLFFSSGNYSTVDFVFLTGGGSAFTGIDGLVQSKLNIKTFMANPFADFLLASQISEGVFNKDLPRLMIACGLALRNLTQR